MEAIEISAKSEEEAVALALAELGLGRSDVEVVILKKGRSGILGFGGQEVTVKVTPIDELSEDKIGAISISNVVLSPGTSSSVPKPVKITQGKISPEISVILLIVPSPTLVKVTVSQWNAPGFIPTFTCCGFIVGTGVAG